MLLAGSGRAARYIHQFLMFLSMFIAKLRTLGYGCRVCGQFVGCILYADDIIILSAFVSGLQSMLDCCFDVSRDLQLTAQNLVVLLLVRGVG